MRWAGIAVLGLVAIHVEPIVAEELIYEGVWKTTNRKLDGSMTCVVTSLGEEKWQGRFYGVWQGVDFDYTVKFEGPAEDLHGTASIDGAAYDWRARMNKDRLWANFSGDRYVGSFDLSRKQTATASEEGKRDTKPIETKAINGGSS